MHPQALLAAAALLTSNGDVSLRDDPITYAWRNLHPDEPPDVEAIDQAAQYVSHVLKVPHNPEGWWLHLARNNSFRIAALLGQAANEAAPKQIQS